MQVMSPLAVKLQPTECMDTPNAYDVLNISLYSILCTVLYTVMYAKLYQCVQVASWEDLFPLERPSPCLLYIVPNTIVYILLNDILYTVLYTTLYSVHCIVHSKLNYTLHTIKVVGWAYLISKAHFPSCIYFIVDKHITVQLTVYCTVKYIILFCTVCTVLHILLSIDILVPCQFFHEPPYLLYKVLYTILYTALHNIIYTEIILYSKQYS